MQISKVLVSADYVATFIPVVSTVTNLIDLFLKYVVMPRLSKETVAKNHYWKQLQEKPIEVCLIALFPLIGNLIIGGMLLYALSRQQAAQPRKT